jgi:AcrR family transcriptional regulator
VADERLDRRVQRTRAALRDALFSLIDERGYAAITVTDITERADINRVTFYFHYKDKDDLLFRVMEELYEALEAHESDSSLEDWAKQDWLFAFQHVQQHAPIYRALLGERGTMPLLGRLIDYSVRAALQAERARLPKGAQPPLPLELVEHFYAGAFVGLLRWWVLSDMPYTPEEMATMCHQLETNSGLWAIGLDERDLTTLMTQTT